MRAARFGTSFFRAGLAKPVAPAAFARTAVVRNLSNGSKKGATLERIDSFIGVSKRGKGRRTAEEAVNSILYNIPAGQTKSKRHIISILVDNESGVLSKVSGLLSARGFNIDSLTVSATDVKELSRMTIVLIGPDPQIEQAKRQLEDLVDVWGVVDYKGESVLERELAIVKVSCSPPEMQLEADNDEPLTEYENMMQIHFQRQAILDIAKMFGAEVNDVGSESLILEIVSWSKRVDAFIRILQPYGVIEAARSGVIAMNRCQVGTEIAETEDERTVVDLADLPPS